MNKIETIEYLSKYKNISIEENCYDDYHNLNDNLMYFNLYKSAPNNLYENVHETIKNNPNYICDIIKILEKINRIYSYIEILYERVSFNIDKYDYDYSDYLKYIINIPNEKILLFLEPYRCENDILSIRIILKFLYSSNIIPICQLFDNIPLKKLESKNLTNYINVIVCEKSGVYDLRNIPISQPKVDIDLHYNDSFKEANKTIIDFLSTKDKSGLIMLNGHAGTGKTTYIRHLINTIPGRFLYLTKDMINAVSDPKFITFLLNFNNVILIIEDCETLLESRNNGNKGTGISNLLNMCDGILSDILRFKIIATFNADISKIDNALLRKGRLIYKYQFDKLETAKANKLLEKLKINFITNKPMVISDIFNFNYDNNSNIEKQNKIGFS